MEDLRYKPSSVPLNLGQEPLDPRVTILDSGYQLVCSMEGAKSLREAITWLSEQIGYSLRDEHIIRQIDHFQLIEDRGYWSCVAVCRAYAE